MRSVLFLALLLGTHLASVGMGATVHYQVAPLPKEGLVRIRATVAGLAPDLVPIIEITERYASVDDFYAEVKNLHVVSPAQHNFLPHEQNGSTVPHMWQLDAAASEQLVYEYDVEVLQSVPETVARFKPSMSPDYLYANGSALFLYPRRYHQAQEPLEVDEFTVEFELPENWQATASFQNQSGEFAVAGLDGLLQSSIALGDYRHLTRQLPGDAKLVIAMRGSWPFSDEQLADTVASVISEQIAMMGTWNSPVYSVTLTPHTIKGSRSGSGLTNAFEMFAPEGSDLKGAYFLIGHENFHYWNGHRIVYEAPRNRWFSEGFTNYYTAIFLARSSMLPLSEALELFSDLYQPYFHSPVRTLINFEDAGTYFWNWNEYSEHFYTKGMLIALLVDVKLRSTSQNTKSLDEFIRRLDRKLAFSGRLLNNDVFLAELNAYSGQDWSEFMATNVAGKSMLQINPVIAEAGMALVTEDCKRPDLGMSVVPHFCKDGEPCGHVATDVKAGGPAWAAGVRPGDHIIKKEYSRKAPATPVSLVIEDPDGQTRSISYKAGTRIAKCHNLRFIENPNAEQASIRASIWSTRR